MHRILSTVSHPNFYKFYTTVPSGKNPVAVHVYLSYLNSIFKTKQVEIKISMTENENLNHEFEIGEGNFTTQ